MASGIFRWFRLEVKFNRPLGITSQEAGSVFLEFEGEASTHRQPAAVTG